MHAPPCRSSQAVPSMLWHVEPPHTKFDPEWLPSAMQDAEVFRRAKGGQESQGKRMAAGTKRTRGVAFGSGAADEDDSYGMMEDYVVADDGDRRKGLLYEIADGSDEEDLPMVMGR